MCIFDISLWLKAQDGPEVVDQPQGSCRHARERCWHPRQAGGGEASKTRAGLRKQSQQEVMLAA